MDCRSRLHIIRVVDDFHSEPETYFERWLTPALRSAVEAHPVVVLTGARQVGKSTLLRHAEPFSRWGYRSLDDFEVLRQAREHPKGLWAGTDRLVLDEVQRAPELLSAIKQAVDEDRSRRFVLSGSANLLLMQRVSESLAGRAVYFVLDPLTLGESRSNPAPRLLADALDGRWPEPSEAVPAIDPLPLMLRGFLPALLPLPKPEDWLRWWTGYVATYLERDLRQITQIDALVDFRRVMVLLALRTGGLLNQADIARDAALSPTTVHRYLNLIESTHLFQRLPPYAGGRTVRLVKAPRVLWTDPGLAIFLAGYFDTPSLAAARELGGMFETLVFLHLRVLCGLLTPPGRLHYWRTRSGDEVDFVIEHGRRLLAIEVKWTDAPGYRHAAGLRRFLQDHPSATGGILVHGGQEATRIDQKIVALPWTMIAGA